MSARTTTALVAAWRLGFGLLALAITAPERHPAGPMHPARPVSVQSCNTECQSEQTDCVLRCDQDAACSEKCETAADACVERCSRRQPA